MRKIIFFTLACFFATSVLAELTEDDQPPPAPIYDPSDGLVEIPKLVVIGQEEEGEYNVKMQQTEGLNFEVASVTPVPNEAGTSDDEPVTYDPATGIVDFPLVIILSEEEDVLLETYSVKMLKQEGEGLFFSVTETNPIEVKSKSSRVIQCWRSFVLKGRTRGIRRFFWKKDCPAGWHPV